MLPKREQQKDDLQLAVELRDVEERDHKPLAPAHPRRRNGAIGSVGKRARRGACHRDLLLSRRDELQSRDVIH